MRLESELRKARTAMADVVRDGRGADRRAAANWQKRIAELEEQIDELELSERQPAEVV